MRESRSPPSFQGEALADNSEGASLSFLGGGGGSPRRGLVLGVFGVLDVFGVFFVHVVHVVLCVLDVLCLLDALLLSSTSLTSFTLWQYMILNTLI